MTEKNNVQCNLSINQFELPVFLGWPNEERHHSQVVSIDIHIGFLNMPKACNSDRLEDTFCYSGLTDQIRKHTAEQPFRLIEHLAHTILTITKELIQDTIMITVSVTKKPRIEGLKGGATFTCTYFKEQQA